MSDMFPRAGLFRQGYRREQVEGYFTTAHEIYDAGELDEMDSEGVRTVAFDIVRGGYKPAAVDSALDRLEAAFLQRVGPTSWPSGAVRPGWRRSPSWPPPSIRGCCGRTGSRFASAHKHGYSKVEVDRLMDRVASYFDAATALSSIEVRTATFSAARKDAAYDERSVDRYLARVVEVLLSVE